MNDLNINGADTLIISIFVLFLGSLLTRKVGFLQKYSIPQAVTGGLIVSLVVLAIVLLDGPKIIFDLSLRDLLLLAFFSTIGLSAKFARLKAGGKSLLILLVCAMVFLVVQNVTGVLMAKLLGVHPGIGLFAGSISFAGGHGTAIAWGNEAKAAGFDQAAIIGIAFATFGLVAGGIIGGPVAERLIKKNNLAPGSDAGKGMMTKKDAPKTALEPVTMQRIMTTIFILAICISVGDVVNRLFFDAGVKLPGFLTSMIVGIAITNFADVFKKEIRQPDFDRVGEVALQLFLAMSLMSMDLNALSGAMGAVMLVLFVQVLVVTLFAVLLVFRVMGKTYDAAVICAGFTGLGLGATPVAIANMNAITSKYGPSFKAFLIVPLVGAFFIDLVNAMVIKFFIGLPFMQVAM
ncbi:sodium/glutamate symporter [Rubritalea profundi]|uniref:Sodium/glutamate symporter n=1 Tax=Rubritalea profundi TaxID=1658618 RepID=A0A2S7U4S7_9BACT|nr:sodium/glutamate symporter [Rubritalea profundi]PQJ30015.1 sodium/glutamate symporter [Rubritalea profundi]